MFTRTSSVCLGAIALAACSEGGTPPPAGTAVACALGGSNTFAEDCTMERAASEEGNFLIVRHPDGGFRRFELGVAGRGIVTADGIEEAVVEQGDGIVTVSVGADRYRLPVAE